MIKRYFNHMHQKSTHERRQHAMRIATFVTAVIFVGWLGTLGMRLGGGATAQENDQAGQTQLANVISTTQVEGNTLQVATSSVYQYQQ
jgi:cell division protein FtsB